MGGPKVFAAGADISEFGGPDEADTVGRAFLEALEAVAAIPRATVAAIGGFALGGGCELALACDLRIASDRARLGQPEILLGSSRAAAARNGWPASSVRPGPRT